MLIPSASQMDSSITKLTAPISRLVCSLSTHLGIGSGHPGRLDEKAAVPPAQTWAGHLQAGIAVSEIQLLDALDSPIASSLQRSNLTSEKKMEVVSTLKVTV